MQCKRLLGHQQRLGGLPRAQAASKTTLIKKGAKVSFQKNPLEHKNRSAHRGETRAADEEPRPLHGHVGEKQQNNQSAEEKNAWSKVPGGRVGHTRGF